MKRRDALFGAAAGSMAMAARAMLPGTGSGSNEQSSAADIGGTNGGRKVGGRVNILDFGADPSGLAPCDQALALAMRSVDIGKDQRHIGGPHIYFPPGTYSFAKTIELKRTVILEGDSASGSGGHTSILFFPADTTGIIVHSYNTTGSGLESVPTSGADASVIRNLQLIGNKAGSTRGHGIWLRARAIIEQVNIRGFKEHGVQVLASVRTPSPAMQGNANCFYIGQSAIGQNDGCGVYVKGNDTNAGVVVNTSCSTNGAWGFHDASFLGNTYIGCLTEANGMRGQVSDGGNRYYVLDEVSGGSSQPGTNPNVWALLETGGVSPSFPQWVAGGNYVTGGSYKSDIPTARNCFVGCYSEDSQAPADVRAPAMVVGGAFSRQRASGTGFMLSTTTAGGTLSQFSMELMSDGSRALKSVFAQAPDQPLTVRAEGDHPRGFAPLSWDEVNGQWVAMHGGSSARTPVRYTTNLNKAQFGRTTEVGGGQIAFAQGVWLGGSLASARYLGNGIAPPVAGEHAVGDRIFNCAPAVGKPKSWVCIAAGVPGTWVSEGNL
jgi:hypothetical protein